MEDRIQELQDHLREVVADRNLVLQERETQSKLLDRVRDWIQENARHSSECTEGGCACGLKEILDDLK